jgi:hypothetical protein
MKVGGENNSPCLDYSLESERGGEIYAVWWPCVPGGAIILSGVTPTMMSHRSVGDGEVILGVRGLFYFLSLQ